MFLLVVKVYLVSCAAMVDAAMGRNRRRRLRCARRSVHVHVLDLPSKMRSGLLEPCHEQINKKEAWKSVLPTSRWKMQQSELAVKAWRITPQSQAQTTITPSITSSALLSPHESRKQSFVCQHPFSFHEFAMPHLDSVAFAPHSPDFSRFLTCQTRLLLGSMRQTLGFMLSPVIW